jgi:hypothetical protein
LTGRQARWIDLFTEYEYTVEYIRGKNNQVADALSRRIDLKTASVVQHIDTVQSMKADIMTAYAIDGLARKVRQGTDPGLKAYRYDSTTGYIHLFDRIYVPRECKHVITALLHEVHDAQTAGHPGVTRTLLSLQRHVFWPKMKHTVQQYVRSCRVCQQDKHRTTLTNGLLQPHDIPNRRWQVISMDYVVALPDTPSNHNAILVVVDKLSKMAHFIPTNITVTAEQTVQLFIDHVFRLHGLPLKIISDRGTQFTSTFWTELWKILGTQLNISTAYHPQTDGQTERVNQSMEAMLRHYVQWNEPDWAKHLSLIEFAYNSSIHTATGYSPFRLTYGEEPLAPVDVLFVNSDSPTANEVLTRLTGELQQARDNIQQSIQRMTAQVNQHRRNITFSVGEMVMLNTTHLRVQAPEASNKFLPKYVGPYKVLAVISPVAYRLELPETMLCHPVFHVEKLQPYIASDVNEFPDRYVVNRSIPPIEAPQPEFVVEAILDRVWRENRPLGNKAKGYKSWREWLTKYVNIPTPTWNNQSAFCQGQTVTGIFLQYEQSHPYTAEQLKWIPKYDKNQYRPLPPLIGRENVVIPPDYTAPSTAVMDSDQQR